MRNLYLFSAMILSSLLFVNCKSEEKTGDINAITKTYFEYKNALNPLEATQNGQNQFNDQLVFDRLPSYFMNPNSV